MMYVYNNAKVSQNKTQCHWFRLRVVVLNDSQLLVFSVCRDCEVHSASATIVADGATTY